MTRHGDDAMQRGIKLTQRLFLGQPVTAAYIRDTFGVSWATAKRDLADLATYLPVAKSVERMGWSVRHELRLKVAA